LAEVAFSGFPEAGIRFLRELERHNRREWFQPRKETFDTQVKAPMVTLVEQINRSLARFAPEYITAPDEAIYRIYRDTRFSADKTPYKTHIAASFRKRGLDKHAAGGFYFSVSPKEVEVAGGVYMPGPEQLMALRRHISENAAHARKLVTSAKLVKSLGGIQGDSLTRMPKGFDANDPAGDLIRRKQWYYYALLDPSIVTTSRVTSEVVERFKLMLPFIEFMNAALKPRKVRIEDLLG
jgi:uncharacterized protein (TIGR02453 family)